jgi:AbrB family looped-hinge helix DNA binding protein
MDGDVFSVVVDERGQIVLPLDLRRRLGIEPGDTVVVVAGMDTSPGLCQPVGLVVCTPSAMKQWLGDLSQLLQTVSEQLALQSDARMS